MKRLRHVDATSTLTSSGVVIRGLSGGGLSFLLPGCNFSGDYTSIMLRNPLSPHPSLDPRMSMEISPMA